MSSSSPDVPSAGSLIWTSLVPLLKIALVAVAGFTLTKKGLFPSAASRGFSQVTMNLALPCLIFASIVPSFNPETAGSIGPLLLTAFVYEAIGLILAFVIREICWVPREFQYGILIMGALSNWGLLPTAIVQSVAASSPFNPATDPALGTGYVSVFILAYNLTFFASGVYRVCGWDFIDQSPEPAPETFGAKWSRRKRWVEATLGRGPATPVDALEMGRGTEEGTRGVISLGKEDSADGQVDAKTSQEDGTFVGEKDGSSEAAVASSSKPTATAQRSRRLSAAQEQQLAAMDRLTRSTSAATVESVLPPGRRTRKDHHFYPPSSSTIKRRVLQSFHSHTHKSSSEGRLPPLPSSQNPSRAPSPTHDLASDHTHSHSDPTDPPTTTDVATPLPLTRKQTYLGYAKTAALSLATPITGSLIVSIIIALVPPLKALFVENVPGWSGGRMPWAPDGRPPLAFVQDTAVFLGSICVPGGTILLGASFARLELPSSSSPTSPRLPYTAIVLMTFLKMVLLPVIGVLFVTSPAVVKAGFYPTEKRILGFVAMLLSGTPAAVNQLVVTQLVAPDGKCDVIAAFLLAQYVFLFISSTALTAIALKFVSD